MTKLAAMKMVLPLLAALIVTSWSPRLAGATPFLDNTVNYVGSMPPNAGIGIVDSAPDDSDWWTFECSPTLHPFRTSHRRLN